jgi:uncharacterized protein YdiU (UPF0061 family)
VDLANTVIKGYGARFQAHWLDGMRKKIGLVSEEDGDLTLVQALLAAMQAGQADFTLTFRRLSALAGDEAAEGEFLSTFDGIGEAMGWLVSWRERLRRDPQTAEERSAAMLAVNPAFIPRNHRIEQAINAAMDDGDFSLFEALVQVLAKPYEDQPGFAAYMEPPKLEERVLQTFCGT